MKKFIAILLTLAMVIGLCACVKPEEGGNKKGSGSGVTLTIGIPSSAKVMSLKNNALTQWLEETTGYKLEFQEYAGGSDIATQISTTIAARNELPDILYGINLGNSAACAYGRDGYFVDLTPYYEDKEGASANFWNRLSECLTEEQQDYVLRTITDGDTGKIFGVPVVETSTIDKRKYQPWINQTWLDKLGLSMPQNTEDLYNVLVAFKTQDPNGSGDPTDEIPLLGAEKAWSSASAVSWIINMFLYYHTEHRFQDYNGDGKLEFVYTQDKYREALQYINKLYKEGLLSNLAYTAESSELKQYTTPSSGMAMCGIFCGHLTEHAIKGNEIMYQYVPMPLWGCAVEGDMSSNMNTFITADCAYPDEAFNLLMTMFSWEGSMRIRYGQYGVNWTDADAGTKSDMGLDAIYKLIDDPLTQQNTAHWGTIASCFNHYAEGETAQIADNMDEWTMKKSQMHAESRRIFDEAQKNNPEKLCPTLIYTTEEMEDTDMLRTNIDAYARDQQMAFVTGIGADINDPADWDKFLATLDEMGMAEYQTLVQTAYERQ